MWQIPIAGFILGLISSVHCVGMCGPLALSLPLQGLPARRRTGALAGYHLGRIGAYVLVGAVSGLLGSRLYIAGMQHGLSILSGVLILFALAGRQLAGRTGTSLLVTRVYSGLQGLVLRLWRSASGFRFLGIGFANGLLPCGMVYIAMAAALSLPGPWEGILFMFCFGAGTLPAMLLLQFSGQMAGASFRKNLRKASPFLMGGMAVLLILRGLNLGIPLISPILAAARGGSISCH